MAEQEGAAAGPNVQHDEFMREDDVPEASGDEDPDAHSAQGPQPILEELEELTVVGVYATGVDEWKTKASELAYAATRDKIRALELPDGRFRVGYVFSHQPQLGRTGGGRA